MAPKLPLEKVLLTADTLLSQYLEILSQSQHDAVNIANPPPPLPLLSDCARLLKAQVTKLSLLAINKPFTPSAISSVLHDTTTGCLPAMMSGVQICDAQRDIQGGFFVDEIRTRVRRVMREMLGLVREVASVAEEARTTTHHESAIRDSLSSTAIVWNGCDEIVSLTVLGVATLAVQKAEAYRDMIKDAIDELQEWREGEDTENEGIEDRLLDSDDEGVDGDRDNFEDIFNAANSLPADRVQLKELVEKAESKLKKVVILYTAVMKRRLKDFPKHPVHNDKESVQRIDKAVTLLKSISNLVDEMTSNFYDLDEEGSDRLLEKLVGKAVECATILQRNAKDAEDEFTNWLAKWKEAIAND